MQWVGWAERVGQGEHVPSSLRGGRGECGYPAAAGNPNLSPPMGRSSRSPPQQKSGLTAQTAVGMVEGDHPDFSSLHIRGEAQPLGPPPSPILAWFRFIQIKQLSWAGVQTCRPGQLLGGEVSQGPTR